MSSGTTGLKAGAQAVLRAYGDYTVSAWGPGAASVAAGGGGLGVAAAGEHGLATGVVDAGEALTFAPKPAADAAVVQVLDLASFTVHAAGGARVLLDFDGDVGGGAALDLAALTGKPLHGDAKIAVDFAAHTVRVNGASFGAENSLVAGFFAAGQGATHLTVGSGAGGFSVRDFACTHHDAPAGPGGAPVLDWIQAGLDSIAHAAASPIYASRALAVESLAVMDALAALKGEPGRLVSLTPPPGASAQAAAIAAAHKVLVELFPTEKAALDLKMSQGLAALSGPGIAAGAAFGESVAAAVVGIRAHDGWDARVTYEPSGATNAWQPTPPAYSNPLGPQWGQVDPFVMTSGDQFRPGPPPALDSQAYADAYNFTKDWGGTDSTLRTADQTEMAHFWADLGGSYTPPGHWDAIAEQLAREQDFGLEASAKLFGMLNLALGDAGIACWDAKYAYATWRPVTAIRNGDADGNPLTAGDPDWTPLWATPPFPEYTSGHSTFSAAAATILTAVFGDHVAFSTTSLTAPGIVRHYDSFEQAAEEAGMSRIYGGIHFQFANLEGQACGTQIGRWVLDAFGTSGDARAPAVVLDQVEGTVFTTRPKLAGWAVDNASALHRISVSLDGGKARTIAVDDHGRFSLPDGLFRHLAGGDHQLAFTARDAAGNTSTTDWSFAWGAHSPSAATSSHVEPPPLLVAPHPPAPDYLF
jgi:hypothetical protein